MLQQSPMLQPNPRPWTSLQLYLRFMSEVSVVDYHYHMYQRGASGRLVSRGSSAEPPLLPSLGRSQGKAGAQVSRCFVIPSC